MYSGRHQTDCNLVVGGRKRYCALENTVYTIRYMYLNINTENMHSGYCRMRFSLPLGAFNGLNRLIVLLEGPSVTRFLSAEGLQYYLLKNHLTTFLSSKTKTRFIQNASYFSQGLDSEYTYM